MATFLFRLPDIGEGIAEAEITAWHVAVGDSVAEDQPLLDVMTDKANVDMSSPVTGVVRARHGAVGERAPVGSVLVELEVAGEAQEAPLPPETRPETPPPAPRAAPVDTRHEPPPQPLAAPATRARAHEAGIDLHDVPGTGPQGRITPADLDAVLARKPAPHPAPRTLASEVPLTGLRRRIAEKMVLSARQIPHFSYVEEADLTELDALRADLNAHAPADEPRLTLLPFFIRALVGVLPAFPHLNARFDEAAGVLRPEAAVHVGVATQTPAGLMVPVIRDAQTLDVAGLARRIAHLATGARAGTLPREALSGSTITVTSLGALGGLSHTPIINHPEVAIIGPNRLVERPVVREGAIAVRKMMNISSSFDHRIVDGHDAARFIQALRRRLEHPALIFMAPPPG